MSRRLFHAIHLLFIITLVPSPAQTGNATLSGLVEDPSGAIVPNAAVLIRSTETGTTRRTASNGAGRFAVPDLKPGRYVVHISHEGFAAEDVNDVVLNVGDTRELALRLNVTSAEVTVTVNGGGETINTTDGTVSTVIDRQFVNGIPLNGRSFQPLILLSPGVITSSPQGNDNGSFSVNGSRTDATYLRVDGLSGNTAAGSYSDAGSAGMASGSTALGTTQAMLPVDALEEFRISTSTYSAEYGRQPGAQISMQSRSGTNFYHGDLYDYLRNTVFEANNWFNKYSAPPIDRLPVHQNDFGGALGGPLEIPRLYSGRDRAFFFFAYEGLRLVQPQAAHIFYVPSNGTYNTSSAYADPRYENLRAYAPPALQPVVNAFPLPNCTVSQNPQCVDYGDGYSPFLSSSRSPASLDTMNGRIDLQAAPWARIFARYSDSPGYSTQISASGPVQQTTNVRTRVFLLGMDSAIGGSLINQLRAQYAASAFVNEWVGTGIGGAQPVNLNILTGLPPVGGELLVEFEDTAAASSVAGSLYTLNDGSLQYQPNAADVMSWSHGRHLFKWGGDYRQTTAYFGDSARHLSRTPFMQMVFTDPSQVVGTCPCSGIEAAVSGNKPATVNLRNYGRQDPTAKNLGLFAMDEWRVRRSLSLSLGLRWDRNPPPSVSGAQQYTYTGNINDPASLGLSALGAPLYRTVDTDLQPRVGVAWTIRGGHGQETVLRGGGGIFYDLISLHWTLGAGYGLGAGYTAALGNRQPFPVTASEILEPPNPVLPPYGFAYIADPNLSPPSTVQWNVSVQQALGGGRSLTVGYVGTLGMNLINWKEHLTGRTGLNPDFGTITQYENGPGSNYNSLQAQLRQSMSHGLQVLASYTWAHAIDSQSTDYAILPVERGNSNHDVRQNFTAATVYSPSLHLSNRLAEALASHWSLSAMAVARSAFPVQVNGPDTYDANIDDYYPARLNINPGIPLYLHVRGVPGGRQYNPAAFSIPALAQGPAGDEPRNFMRGFGEAAADLALERRFHLYEGANLNLRAETFNVTNHPNFGALNVSCGSSANGANCTNSLMGQATNMISDSLVGATALYQQGGPRSMQFLLRFDF